MVYLHHSFKEDSNATRESGFCLAAAAECQAVKALGLPGLAKPITGTGESGLASHPDLHAKLQKTSVDNSGPQNAKKVTASQQNISAALLSASKYKSDTKEQQTKEEAIAKWIGCTGLPVTTAEDEDFVLMMETVDRRLTVPKRPAQ
ncbi:hypothetical protein SRHO_G00044030 [Serrasalmus rhombeus]